MVMKNGDFANTSPVHHLYIHDDFFVQLFTNNNVLFFFSDTNKHADFMA